MLNSSGRVFYPKGKWKTKLELALNCPFSWAPMIEIKNQAFPVFKVQILKKDRHKRINKKNMNKDTQTWKGIIDDVPSSMS